ncbi:MAG TPA: DUF72 domain-containing protein [Methylomirabilota bacterium]|nr:DUF72 domain-containing protein [Methylomirabilota bacterium]
MRPAEVRPIVLYEPPKRLRTDYRIGLSAWTDKSMLEEGHFYPRKTMSAEERLWWYSRFFDVVEVNSSFYAIPSVETTTAWVTRTSPSFLFNVKALGILTGHHGEASRLPDALRVLLPRGLRGKRAGRIPNDAFGAEARAWALTELRAAVRPLAEAGKLGYVLFQLAPWVKRSEESLEYLASLPARLPDMDVAVEFRSRSWFGPHTDETLKFLAAHRLTYVCIDGPRGRATVPSLSALTSPTAVFRLHGRNFKGFLAQVQGKTPTVAEKYDYLYRKDELEGIARTAGALNGKAQRVHMAMNNNRGDYPAINGIQLKEMLLEDWEPPDRDALLEELNDRRAAAKRKSKPRSAAA